MMAAFNSPPATVDDFAKLINGRYIQGGPGLLFKGPSERTARQDRVEGGRTVSVPSA